MVKILADSLYDNPITLIALFSVFGDFLPVFVTLLDILVYVLILVSVSLHHAIPYVCFSYIIISVEIVGKLIATTELIRNVKR